MPRFNYQAMNLHGDTLKGVMEAADAEAVKEMLRGRSYYPVSVKQSEKGEKAAVRKRVKIKPLAIFCMQMATVLRAGVPLAQAFDIMRQQTENPVLKKILDDVYAKIQSGKSLSESFAPYSRCFPTLFLSMIEAGEMSGSLEVCLSRAGDTFTRSAKLSNKLKGAMIYPCILLSLTLVIVIVLMVVVVPIFTEMFASRGQQMPAMTQTLINISDMIKSRWFVLLGGAALAFTGIKALLATKTVGVAVDKMKLKIPVVGKLLVKVYSARYSRTLATMNAAGVPLTGVLEVTAKTIGNRFMEEKVRSIIDNVRMGEGLSAPLERIGVFPPMITQMTRLGEESGSLDNLLEQAASFYEEESESAVSALTAMLEPCMIILMAVVVIPVVLAILQPVLTSSTGMG